MRFRISALLALALLSACGQAGPTTAPEREVDRPVDRPAPVATAPALPTGLDPAVQAMVARGIARLDTMKTVQGHVVFEETKDGKSETGRAKIAFRNKPFAGRVDIEQSARWLAAGGVVVWKGGTELKVRPLKLPFSLSFATDNSQVVSLRGYRMDQTDLFSMAKVLRAPGAQIRPLGARRVRNEDLFMLEVRSGASVPGIEREVIGLHQKHLVPTYREMYQGGQMVHRGQGINLSFDRPVDDDLFDI
jgi:predicted small lipoprotein YifL